MKKKVKNARKKFFRIYKKEKKELIKQAKGFHAVDFGFAEGIFYQSLKIIYEFLKEPLLLMQDTKHEYSSYNEDLDALKRVLFLFDKIYGKDFQGKEFNEYEARNEIYTLIANHITGWWD